MHSTTPVFKIIPTTQKYDWGKVGRHSKVAQFAELSRVPNFTLDESAPYGELWMGTHPSGPSRVFASGEILSEHLQKHPDLLSQGVIKKFNASNGNLPFLFKVLSIEKALSIQTHPDKKTAEVLHANQPHIYKDPNHKPEMAIAITPFRALCGFLPLLQISIYLRTTPEFSALIPQTIVESFITLVGLPDANASGPAEKAALKTVFEAVMTAEEHHFKAQLAALVQRYESGGARGMEGENQTVVDLVLQLNRQFPGDIGVFCAFLLNDVSLKPGNAIFLGAGEPHAYVSGDIMECMANSDNVIRAGLTPKLRDIPNLVSGLTYISAPPSKHVVYPESFKGAEGLSTLYDPPIPEFSVVHVQVPHGEEEKHEPVAGPSITVVTGGQGRLHWGSGEDWEELAVSLGDVLFIAADTEVKFSGAEEANFELYRAFVEA
ncbi:mannose-6-phosphate isomerase [Pluteus cervinus]|uniref:Mannose-6-phosphate isomerase n=1 Tax=Pluteus cervinus TaxID=181527 RepID=A0ACD3AKE4_9AGAR|nr:mannose-6-phosphate isomerase [Pluteus cervinus]